MNDIAAPFRQLVERRLWPIAALLVAALVAVPLLLADKGEDAGVPPATAVASTAAAETDASIVSVTDAAERESTRRVLGNRKNPFRPAIKAKKAKVTDAGTTNSLVRQVTGGGTSSGGGASAGGGTSAPATPVAPAGPTEPKKTYELYSLTVRFGESSSEKLPSQNLKRLTALPDSEKPALIYLGLLEDKKTAVFLVDAGAKVQGDGKCLPEPENCQTLQMKAGDTVFVDTVPETEGGQGVQYQLDLVKIRTSKTTDAKAAARSRAVVSKDGRKALRARIARAGMLRYDAGTGTLERLSVRQYNSALARAAARAAVANAG